MPRLNCWNDVTRIDFLRPFYLHLYHSLPPTTSSHFLHTHPYEGTEWEGDVNCELCCCFAHSNFIDTQHTHSSILSLIISIPLFMRVLCVLYTFCWFHVVRLHFTRSHTYRKQQMKWNKKPNNQQRMRVRNERRLITNWDSIFKNFIFWHEEQTIFYVCAWLFLHCLFNIIYMCTHTQNCWVFSNNWSVAARNSVSCCHYHPNTLYVHRIFSLCSIPNSFVAISEAIK